MKYQITIAPMQAHINGGENVQKTFSNQTFDITQFHHWGFAEWLNEEMKENPVAKISANVYHDETESVYYADIYVDDELCDSFYYIEEKEIYDDLATARKQFSATIVDSKPLC